MEVILCLAVLVLFVAIGGLFTVIAIGGGESRTHVLVAEAPPAPALVANDPPARALADAQPASHEDDPRLAVAVELLVSVRRLSDTPRVHRAVDELEVAVRRRLALIAHVQAAIAAHAALGQADDPALRAVLVEHEDALDTTLAEARELHVAVLDQQHADAPSVDDVVARLRADSEVDDLG